MLVLVLVLELLNPGGGVPARGQHAPSDVWGTPTPTPSPHATVTVTVTVSSSPPAPRRKHFLSRIRGST